jgi:hypothetical protein
MAAHIVEGATTHVPAEILHYVQTTLTIDVGSDIIRI